MSEEQKPKAKIKDINLPDAPKPTKAEHIEIKGGVRSSAAITRAKKIREYKDDNRKYHNFKR